MSKNYFLGLVLAMLFIGCDNGSSSIDSKKFKPKIQDCIEPHNPFNDDGGHDAGFNRAMENGGDCNGNSDSFNEGCAEFHTQLNRYNECIANKNKQ